MSDLPGPEKPPPWLKEAPEPARASHAELMSEFQRLLGRGPAGTIVANPHFNHYNGRSGRYLGRKVRDRHKIVVMLAVCGLKNNEIAASLGYTQGRVSIILNSKHPELLAVREAAIERVAHSTADLTAQIRLAAPKALEKMVGLLNSSDEKIVRVAARDILDRAGYSPVKKSLIGEVKVPMEELGGVLGRIHEANEVVMERDNWVVKSFPRISERRQQQQDGAA